MLFVKTDDLKMGMRLAKPIYNKNGVMLYERNSKLTNQGIVSINNFGLIGVYILEAAEPLPPMSADDIEFERFQAMSVFTIKEILDAVCKQKEPKDLYQFSNLILKNYGSLHRRINFIQNLRSTEDYVYKHSLNTAILSALISGRMKLEFKQQIAVVVSSILHDVGTLLIPMHLRRKRQDELTDEEIKMINTYYLAAHQMYSRNADLDPDIKRTVADSIVALHSGIVSEEESGHRKPGLLVEILKVAYTYDTMTAMKLDEEPLSEIAAIRHLLNHPKDYEPTVVSALLESINILNPGVCVELTNGDKGLVVTSNENSLLEPFILSFSDNKLYNLSDGSISKEVQIRDIMKTMDNRHVMDNEMLAQYSGEAVRMGEKRDKKHF